MSASTIQFKGCYTAIVTPFSPDGRAVDEARLADNVRFQAQGGVTGIVPCGTTGESPTLTEAEHTRVVEVAVCTARPLGLQVVAGAGSNNTAHAIHLHTLAKRLGADASLQVTPYYNKPSQEGLYRHFMAVADSCDLPVMLYNIPGRSGVPITPETVERLSRHPNIRAIKEATGSLDSASEIRQRCGITLLSGDDSLTVGFAAVGATGVVSVVSNLVPERIAALCRHTAANDFHAALTLHQALFPLSKGLLGLDTNPVPVKAAMALLGRDSGMVRLPMAPASAAVVARVRELLRSVGLEPAAAPCPGPIAAGAAS
ncbi:MAG: 4-hydroxy-tetrahydrodipicolinate synthase [Phycisphaerales bacterium]